MQNISRHKSLGKFVLIVQFQTRTSKKNENESMKMNKNKNNLFIVQLNHICRYLHNGSRYFISVKICFRTRQIIANIYSVDPAISLRDEFISFFSFSVSMQNIHSTYLCIRYRPRFFDQVGHQTTYASIGNRHFFTLSCHRQTNQNYEQSRQKLGTFLENKVL